MMNSHDNYFKNPQSIHIQFSSSYTSLSQPGLQRELRYLPTKQQPHSGTSKTKAVTYMTPNGKPSMATHTSKNRTHAPSSSQVTTEPEKASTSEIIGTLCTERIQDYQRVIVLLKAATELEKKVTLLEAVQAQNGIFQDWVKRNRMFLRNSASIKDTRRKPLVPPQRLVGQRRRYNRSHVRFQIIDVLEWIQSPLSEMSEILGEWRVPWEALPERKRPGAAVDSDSCSGSDIVDIEYESELQQHVDDLVRFNNILLLWTEVIGDRSPTGEGVRAGVENSLGRKSQLKQALVWVSKVVLKRSSEKERSRRNAYSKAS